MAKKNDDAQAEEPSYQPHALANDHLGNRIISSLIDLVMIVLVGSAVVSTYFALTRNVEGCGYIGCHMNEYPDKINPLVFYDVCTGKRETLCIMGAGSSWSTVKRYDTSKVCAILVLFQMDEHVQRFKEHGINGKKLLALDDEGLAELGVEDGDQVTKLKRMKKELWCKGGKVIKQVITPFPLPPPPEVYLGVADREHIYLWDPEQVQAMLELNNLGGYKQKFKEKKITGSLLMQMSDRDLVTEFGMEEEVDLPRLGAALEWNYFGDPEPDEETSSDPQSEKKDEEEKETAAAKENTEATEGSKE